MKKKRIKDIYFRGVDDRNLTAFTERFLESGLLWVYIAINREREWKEVYEKLSKDKKLIFRNEYNKAFSICYTYRELTKLFLGKELHLKNLFLIQEAESSSEKFVKIEKVDELRWKEVIELIA